jgi:multiple sugar transport system substrate-binding protein
MTWNHPRGLDPLVAHAREYEQRHGVRITWDARSLEDFEAFPLDELAARYDLMVIDHPHVGMAAASGCLLPLEPQSPDHSVGYSHQTYNFAGKQWALAIDAAAQVSCRRTGAFKLWPVKWEEVDDLMRERRTLCPLAPVHALMCFFTLCANAEHSCDKYGQQLVDRESAERVLARLRLWASLLPEFCFNLNPIGAYERMLQDKQFVYVPLIYGYVSYARGQRGDAELDFGDIPGLGGSTLGGTGIAVSAKSENRQAAVAVAYDLASEKVQRGVYASAGGQPAHRAAWTDQKINVDVNGFYRKTLGTVEHAYVRPRFNGYIAFQESAGQWVAACMKGDATIAWTIDWLNEGFARAQGR